MRRVLLFFGALVLTQTENKMLWVYEHSTRDSTDDGHTRSR